MKILIAGDYVPRNRLAPLVQNNQFEEIFGQVREIVSLVDYAIVNFESPIVGEGDSPIPKCGPNLRCTPKAVDAIKYAGFSCVTLANNHIRDFGDSAVRRTINELTRKGVDSVGAGSNIQEASQVLFKTIGGERIAIVNCCENEFSIATNEHYGANPLNPVKQYYAIKEARDKADYVVVIVHGGHEHHQLPSPRMQDTYRFFVDAGADIVVNHHQHCYSGYEIYKERPIVYGLGNFCMDKDPIRIGQIWNYGYMVIWDTKAASGIQIVPYNQCGEKPEVQVLSQDAFMDKLSELNGVITDRKELEEQTALYYSTTKRAINDQVIEPIQNRFIAGLQHHGLLPSLITKKWLLKLQDFILCESHRDKMDYYFKNR